MSLFGENRQITSSLTRMAFFGLRDIPIKVPLRYTYVFDYIWFACMVVLLNFLLSDGSPSGLRGLVEFAVADASLRYTWLLKEKLYLRIFSKELGPQKLSDTTFRIQLSLDQQLAFVLQILVFSRMSGHFFGKTVTWRTVTLASYLQILRDAAVTYLIHDLFYNSVHKFVLHSPRWYGRFHKTHHAKKGDANGLNSYMFDAFENVVYPLSWFMAFSACIASRGGDLHVLSLIMFVRQGRSNHSANPYTPFLYNPLLDFFFKPTVAHSLHHALNNRNFYEFPLHHLFGFGADVDTYNKTFGTNITYPFFGLF